MKSAHLWTALVLASLPNASLANEPDRFRQSDDFDYDAHMAKLASHPPDLTSKRLPHGYQIGRCLLVVDGQKRISGKCAYTIEHGGDFHIDGPRQIFDGVDYPKAEIMAAMLSTDYWANVFKDEHGGWAGYGNDNLSSVHGEGHWGALERHGACYRNYRVTVCLWEE
jgi:hypothetical protein